MDLYWQSNVSAFKYAVYSGHNCSSKEQASFNFMATVTIWSDFGALPNPPAKYKDSLFPLFSHLFVMKWWD